MANALLSWELLYDSVEKDIKNDQDILVCLTHLVLISHGFKIVGLGESKTLEGDETETQALPKHWNQHYAIRYINQGRLYNFKATVLDDVVMINLIRVDERSMAFVQLNSRSIVKKTGTLDEMIPDNESISDMIEKQLIDKVITSKKYKDNSCQTRPVEDYVTSPGRSRIVVPWNFIPIHPLPLVGSRNYGQRPARRLGNPLRAIPPGARNDPLQPPDADRVANIRPNRPDNDEFQPPEQDDILLD
ncbi:proteasome inhibitor PI31 subunit-like [Leptinotarsa decemlineata]|uniref:proteasome inhibitor PI31 subunit-like n=1 Tax=Leptinotarsa decemlineata TaxID=7539 RepID=UPI000C255876|nr:proteasome inhibitor PI31 subunit-like [Leptinotarsa decemlineata]